MHGNGLSPAPMLVGADAHDLNPLVNGKLQNDWIANDCDTENVADAKIPFSPGLICVR
jgi:hypothetical protein